MVENVVIEIVWIFSQDGGLLTSIMPTVTIVLVLRDIREVSCA